MRRQIVPAIVMVVAMTVLTGLVYTFAFTGVAQIAFGRRADGSLVEVDGRPVGSELMGQAFVDDEGAPLPEYFQPRPSAATTNAVAGYDPSLSLGSNLGPSNPCFVPDPDEPCLDDDGEEVDPIVVARVKAYRELNGLPRGVSVPVDAVTASGSGLDPHISVANARLQARRVAEERSLSLRRVNDLIDDHTASRTLGILGEKRVNVLLVNIDLDRVAPLR